MPLADLGAYLARIGVEGPAPLARIHRAHATTIPFENFDPLTGQPNSLELSRLEEKMVAHRRGGYCFEHNLLLKAALESLGVKQVEPMLARVRMSPDADRGPLAHLLLRVVEDERVWLADVGFGGGGLLDPIPFEVGPETDQEGWRYRLREDGSELVLQVFQDGDWRDCYGFVPEPVPFVDIEVGNWFTSTHPASPFVAQVFAGARRVDRCVSLFASDKASLIEREVGGPSVVTEVDLDEVPAILSERFGLPGVSRADGRFSIAEPDG